VVRQASAINDQYPPVLTWSSAGQKPLSIVDYPLNSSPRRERHAHFSPITPGELLREGFLRPMGITA